MKVRSEKLALVIVLAGERGLSLNRAYGAHGAPYVVAVDRLQE